jgi:two-component system response regulator HydG
MVAGEAWDLQRGVPMDYVGNISSIQGVPQASPSSVREVHTGAVGSILVADDDPEMCELARTALTSLGHSVRCALSASAALDLLDAEDFDVLLADVHMDEVNGLELCSRALAKRPDLTVVVMTGFGTFDYAVGALRAGAYDFLTKPVSLDSLNITLERALRHRALTDELRRLRRRVETRELANMVGESEALKRMQDLIVRVASTDTNVLICGESGTGKELVARALHQHSDRKGPFLAINCAALPENLLEAELFGHVRGAFTDARTTRAGLFVEANGGTVFLDEVGEMAPGMQAKLLRALQERKVRPIGSSQEQSFDARFIAATNRDLERQVQDKQFREDLFYRLNVVRIDVPPLRERGNDVLKLAQFFLQRAAERSGKSVTRLGNLVAERLVSYRWPGNVRELENCMERAVALARFDEITLDDLPSKIREQRLTEAFVGGDMPTDLPPMHVVEERYTNKVLDAVKGNKTRAAKILGFDRRTLYRKLKTYSQDASKRSAN